MKERIVAYTFLILGLLALVSLVAVLIAAWHTVTIISNLLLWLALVALSLAATGYGAYHAIMACLTIAEKRQALRHANEKHLLEQHLAVSRVYADSLGNYPVVAAGPQLTYLEPGNTAHSPRSIPYQAPKALPEPQNTITEDNEQEQADTITIPTTSQLIDDGVIGPGQRDILFCYEIAEDEENGHTEIVPIHGQFADMYTMFIAGGSQSGKSTYMAKLLGEAVAMGALLYVIDPHKHHPEKSLTAKIAALSSWFILPPAASTQEIRRVLDHAQKEKDARIAGKRTALSGYQIIFVVDEAVALMRNQKSADKEIKHLYTDLALFMQSLGVETAKFNMTGLFASQFVTKKAVGTVDFRDACTSMVSLRLPRNQAESFGFFTSEELRAIPHFPRGHGYLMLATGGDPIRIAFSNTTPDDLSRLATLLPPSPLVKRPGEMSMKRPVSAIERGSFSRELSLVKSDETSTEPPAEMTNETASQAEYQQYKEMKQAGFNQGQIILKLWGVKPGATQTYRDALARYRECEQQLAQEQLAESEA